MRLTHGKTTSSVEKTEYKKKDKHDVKYITSALK
jgi:hypothetical protein